MTTQEDGQQVIDSMITWLDEHWSDGMHPSIAAEIAREDPRTYREIYDAGLITNNDVITAWLDSVTRAMRS